MADAEVNIDKDKQISDILSKRDCAIEVIMRLRSKLTSELVGLIASILLFGSNIQIIQLISVPLTIFFVYRYVSTQKELKYLQSKYNIK